MSPGRFKAILSDQLRLGEAECPRGLGPRPSTKSSAGARPEVAAVVARSGVEREVGLTREQIAELDEGRGPPKARRSEIATKRLIAASSRAARARIEPSCGVAH